MKKIIIPMLAAVALMGCSNEENGGNVGPDELVPIQLSAGLGVDVTSKAPVNPDDSPLTKFTAGVAGWETDEAAGPDFATAEIEWVSTAADIEASTTAKTVTLNPTQYYNADEAYSTYIRAWYPEGTVDEEAGTVTFTNTDGSVDAMLAATVDGNKKDKGTPLTLAFEHQTAQLNFVVKKDASLDEGTTLEYIRVKGVSLPTGFDLKDYEVSSTAVATEGLTVPGINSVAIDDATDGTSAGDAVMIMPLTGNTITIDVATNMADYTDQTFTVDTENVEAGKAYTITLTFTQTGISLQATVAAWVEEEGSGTIK